MRRAQIALAVIMVTVLWTWGPVGSVRIVAHDLGPRPGDDGGGGPLAGISEGELKLWVDGLADFLHAETVADGLGPRFNGLSCAECHKQGGVGGTAPAVNPQVAAASALGATNVLPSFITLDGPVREARFKSDGGVHALFTIAGRTDAPGCAIEQDDFAAHLARGNVSFRIPTPVFGAGLMEAISEATVLANQASLGPLKRAFGITGKPNRNGNDGRLTVFGWKAQNASLLMFAGEAYNVEMGITNELFPQERDQTSSCQFASVPNDITEGEEGVHGGVTLFAAFMRFHAPPKPSLDTPGGAQSILKGRTVFNQAGCALCHTPQLITGAATSPALANQPVPLFSDLLLHAMGPKLADGIAQGAAGGDEFRTAPLWGLGQRLFFLHDGRCRDLPCAIAAHASSGNRQYGPSEANAVISRYNGMSEGDKQDLLNFLRSL